jgi:hypothetical protein
MNSMRFSLAGFGFLGIAGLIAVRVLPAKGSDNRQPIAWCYVQQGPLELVHKAVGRRTTSLSLGRGTLASVLKTESKKGSTRALLRNTDLTTLNPVEGWVDTSQAEIIPLDRFPSDEEILRQLRIERKSDFTTPQVGVARWLVKQGDSGPALVCFVASIGLPAARLVAFLPDRGTFKLGPSLEFSFSEMKPGIISGEVRDLLGDGVECLITHEPFREGPAAFGMNMVIRRLEHGKFLSLWVAPLESRNLSFFPPQVQILRPLERNAGAPGTVTKGEVEFQPRGKIYIPVWKATVEFFAVGEDKPLDSIRVTKACGWNGSEFESLR